jgi:hypothetical protein
LHLLRSPSGTKRTNRDVCYFVRFRAKADMRCDVASIAPVANDP